MPVKQYFANSVLLIIWLISKLAIAYDYIPNEDVTMVNLDFSNNENSGEYYDPVLDREKNYQELNYKYSSEEDVTQKNVYTTMVPDNIQMIADINSNEEDFLKDNESRLDDSNETSSFSMTNSIYAEKDVDLSKNISEDSQMMMDSFGDYIDQLETGTTTLTAPTVRIKQGKQIQIIKMLPHEALRNYIEDAYIRTPLAVVVDTSPNSLEKTKVLWKEALRPNAALDIVLLAFNASGISVTYHFQNTRTFLAGLESIKDDSTGNAFYGIIKASELVPYDSGVFVSTSSVPADSNLARAAAVTLLKKRIRLYLIWFGQKCFSENETQEITGGILGEVAIRSGGEILHVDHSPSGDFDENMLTLISNYRGPQQVEVPSDTTASNLRSKVDGAIQASSLETSSSGAEIFDNTLQSLNTVEMYSNKMLKEHNETDFFRNVTKSKKSGKQIAALQGGTKIDIGIQSQLLVAPGMMAQIYFEVTNIRNEPISHSIQVTDEQRFLQFLNPQRIFLRPQQMAIVSLSVMVPSSAIQGSKDIITFACMGYGQNSQTLLLKVLSDSDRLDTNRPSLMWTFGSRCDNMFSGSCANRIWNLDITGQDLESGLLRIDSSPKGIIQSQQFIVGTTEAVRVAYYASCCIPRVTIAAYDLTGNQRSITIDVRDIVLTEASIAAISLGVVLLLLLIAVTICLIIWCCRRKAASQELPSFRSHPERSR